MPLQHWDADRDKITLFTHVLLFSTIFVAAHVRDEMTVSLCLEGTLMAEKFERQLLFVITLLFGGS